MRLSWYLTGPRYVETDSILRCSDVVSTHVSEEGDSLKVQVYIDGVQIWAEVHRTDTTCKMTGFQSP